MNQIARTYSFSSAHRIEGHPKCGRLHGHNYKLVVVLEGPLSGGMVMDFSEMDKVLNPILAELDHRYLVSNTNVDNPQDPYKQDSPDEWFCRLPIDQTTAEFLAQWIYNEIWSVMQIAYPHLAKTICIKEVTLWETDRSSTTYQPNDK